MSRPSPLVLIALAGAGGFVIWGIGSAIVGGGSGSADPEAAPSASASLASGEQYPNFWPEPPPRDVGALLGVGPGSELAKGWMVRGVSPPHEKRIVLDVARGDTGFRVWVTALGGGPGVPPRQTQKYALYTVQPRPTADAVKSEEYTEVLDALAKKIEQTEGRVPTPKGL